MRVFQAEKAILSVVVAMASLCASGEILDRFSCENILLGSAARSFSSRSPFIYHLMPRLAEGGLLKVQEELIKLKSLGVNTLWLGPVHPQTAEEHWYRGIDGQMHCTVNDHGYWVADHQTVDEKLGGIKAFAGVVREAHRLGMKVVLDSPLNHFGYGDAVMFNGASVRPETRPDLFSTARSAGSEDYAQVDNGTDPAAILAAQDRLAQFRLMDLNDVNFDSPEVRHYLIASYMRFIDIGVDGFRLDAVKHLPRDFVAQFINELTDYAKLSGKNQTFLLELLIHNDPGFRAISQDILDRVRQPDNVYFIDFPFQSEVRRFDRGFHAFRHFMGFVRHRHNIASEAQRFIPMLIDHDLAGPVEDRFIELMMVAVSEFFSPHPVIIHHGSEEAAALKSSRQRISSINDTAYKAQLQTLIRRLTEPLNGTGSGENTYIHAATDNLLIAEHRGPRQSVMLMVNQSGASETVSIPVSDNFEILDLQSVGTGAEASAIIVDSQGEGRRLNIVAPGRTLLVLQVTE